MFNSKFLRKMTKRSFKLRNVVAIAICLAGVTMFSGCGGSSSGSNNGSGTKYENTPTGAAQKYFDYAIAGKLEEAAKCFYFKQEKTEAELKDVTKMVEAMFGNVKSYEIISEKISENWYSDGVDKGEVMVKFTKADGKVSNTQTFNTIKVDGVWKAGSGR